jgi:hypothetical protein
MGDYLPRGVYRAPALSSAGNPVFFVVDFQHREVEGSRVEIPPGTKEQAVINQLWRLLDAADPEHSQRVLKKAAPRAS